MPRSSALRQERYKPNVFDRMKQSAEDKKRRGHLKVVADPPPRQPRVEVRNGFFNNTVTIQTQLTNVGTLGDQLNQFVGMPLTMQTTNSIITTASTWVSWNQQMNLNTGGNSVAWRVWTDAGTAGTTSVDCWDTWQTPIVRHQDAWGRWIDNPSGCNTPRRFVEERNMERYRVHESEEQKKLREDQEARWRAEALERDRKYAEEKKLALEANERAMVLLKSCLTPEQRACLERNKYFIVQAKSGRRYRIDEGTHGNVRTLDRDNKVIERLCIQPGGVPVGDSMLAQKLLIEAAEDIFRQHANITLNDGKVIYGVGSLLDADKLAPVIPIFGKKALEKSLQPVVIERAG